MTARRDDERLRQLIIGKQEISAMAKAPIR